MGAELILEIQKQIFLGGIMCLITFMVILTNEKDMAEGDILPDKMYFWLFTFLCWIIMLFTSKLLTKDDDDESFLDTAPKHFMSLIWFTYMVSTQAGIANPNSKGFVNPVSITSTRVGCKKGGSKRGGSGHIVEIGPMTNAAKHLIVMGIIMALINSFSYLYIYGRCKSEVNDSNILKQIHGAQINIIVIGVVAIAIYIFRTSRE